MMIVCDGRERKKYVQGFYIKQGPFVILALILDFLFVLVSPKAFKTKMQFYVPVACKLISTHCGNIVKYL